MITKNLNPNQIITLNDYPLHSDTVLNRYFIKCNIGGNVPLVPVIKKETVKKYFDYALLKKFKQFEGQNPKAEYFMLDGSHRTTALTLNGCKIKVIIYRNGKDIREARKLVKTGQVLENDTLNRSLEENSKILNRHFTKKPYFMTVEQKTIKMVVKKILPKKIINSYRNIVKSATIVNDINS